MVVDRIHTIKQHRVGIDPRLRAPIEESIGVCVRDYERLDTLGVQVHEFVGVFEGRPFES